MKKSFEFGNGDGREYRVTAAGLQDVAYAQSIWDAADDGGIIQADKARELFNPPAWHTTMDLHRAFSLAGYPVELI